MFLNNKKKNTGELYVDELRCLHQIFEHSQTFLSDSEGDYTTDDIATLVDKRKIWLDILKKIEVELKINAAKDDENTQDIKTEISELAHNIIALDAEIMNILSVRKKSVIKELTKIADNKSRTTKGFVNEDKSRIIDIRQE